MKYKCYTRISAYNMSSFSQIDLTKSDSFIHDNPIITNAFINIHNLPLTEKDPKLFRNPEEKFGILEIEISKTEQTDKPTYLEMDIDVSSSMEDRVKDLLTKLDFVKKTLECMCQFISEQPNAVFYIKVNIFDNQYMTVIPATRVTLENRLELIQKISIISTKGSTNIERTFLESGKSIQQYRELNPTHKIVYILLTDGNPTSGNTDSTHLESIKPLAENKCIGYGDDHNANLLGRCGDYYFINDFDNTGKVYGEILHKLLYPALEDITIYMKNGEIFNSKTNSWETSLKIPDLYSQQKRIFHVKTSTNDIEANLYGKIVGKMDGVIQNEIVEELYTISLLPDLLDDETGEVGHVDLRKYMYRQNTQELMFESIEYAKQNIAPESYKDSVQAFFNQMREYMRENDLLEDPFMKLLCDDILVTFKTFGTDKAEMYTTSRHSGQSNQSACRASSQPLENLRKVSFAIAGIKRCNALCQQYDYEENVDEDAQEDDLNRFTSQQQDDTLFTNNDIQKTMRCVSGL